MAAIFEFTHNALTKVRYGHIRYIWKPYDRHPNHESVSFLSRNNSNLLFGLAQMAAILHYTTIQKKRQHTFPWNPIIMKTDNFHNSETTEQKLKKLEVLSR